MSGTKWVYITNNPSSTTRRVYITNDPSKGERVHVTNNQTGADEWVYITNNPSNSDLIYVENPSNLPSDAGTFTAANSNDANSCGCMMLLVILGLTLLYLYNTGAFFDIFSPINTSTIISSPNSPNVEITLTPTSNPEISQLCSMWKTVRKDLSGSRYDIWLQFVSTRPQAMAWSDFKEKSLVCNPVLIKDGFAFIKGKEYLLP